MIYPIKLKEVKIKKNKSIVQKLYGVIFCGTFFLN